MIQVRIATNDGGDLVLPAVVVPHICDPVRTCSINPASGAYEHLTGLKLADSEINGGDVEIDLLIGSDFYWKMVTGRVVRGDNGPTAIETRLGWVLSGPVGGAHEGTMVNFVSTGSTHLLRIDSSTESGGVNAELRRFWDLESLGILREENQVQEQFSQQITFKQGRYEVQLPWKNLILIYPIISTSVRNGCVAF